MKRPKFEQMDLAVGRLESYINRLEKYADHLEKQNEHLQVVTSTQSTIIHKLEKQNAELFEGLKQFRSRIYQQSFSNMQLREIVDSLISIQNKEGGEK